MGEEPPQDGEAVSAPPAQEDAETNPKDTALAAALKRSEGTRHCNVKMQEYLHLHTAVEPVLVVEDPYTIVPDPPIKGEPIDYDGPEGPSHRALGMLGMQDVR